jgi:hypothetical protein
MPLTWVMFNLTGTLVDPSVMAQPLGDSATDEDMIQEAIDDAIAQAMASTLTGAHIPLSDLIEAGLRRRLRLAGRDEALELDRIAAEPVAAHRQLLSRPDQHVLSDHPPEVVQRLPQRTARLIVTELRPEKREQHVPADRSPLRHEGQIGEKCQALGLGGGGTGIAAGPIALQAYPAECLELNHGQRG